MSLSAVGVKVVVVHYDQLPLHEAMQWHQAAVLELGLEKMAEFGADLVYRIPPVDSTHELAVKLMIPDRLPIAASIRVGLLVRGMDDLVRISPRLSQRERVIVEWIEQSTGQILIEEGSLEWSPASDPSPTSAPQILSAAYVWEGPRPQVVTTGPIPMSVRTVNTGRATWLADTEGLRGSVYLGWRWYKRDQEISGIGGREPLTYDVFPGQAFTFQSKIAPPIEPGEYRLELELFSDLVTRFASQGEPPTSAYRARS